MADDTRAKLAPLLATLLNAKMLYGIGDAGGRQAALLALAAMIDFLENAGVPTALLEPVIVLHGAVADLDDGATSAMLAPRKSPGRPPLTTAEQIPRVFAALALELLLRAGERKQRAAERVARAVQRWNVVAPSKRGALDWHTVVNWRNHVSGGLAGDLPTKVYRDYLAAVDEHKADPRQMAEAILLKPPFCSVPRRAEEPPP